MAASGARTELHYLDVSNEELLRRLEARNADLPAGVFWIDPAWIRQSFEIFAAPVAEELAPREAPG